MTEPVHDDFSRMRNAAADPTTAAEMLDALAHHPEPRVRERVAGNPNTPVPTLWHVGAEFPDALWANPVLPLLLVEDPACLHRIDDPRLLSGLLRSPDIPAPILAQLRSHPSEALRALLAQHVSAASLPLTAPWQQQMQSLLDAVTPEEVDYIWLNLFPLPGVVQPWWSEALAGGASATIRQRVATSPDLPRHLFAQLARDPDAHVRSALAENEATPLDVLARLAADGDQLVRADVAKHPHVSVAMLEQLAHDPFWLTRQFVAKHPLAPQSVLAQLVTDERDDVWIEAMRRYTGDAQALLRQAQTPLSQHIQQVSQATDVTALRQFAADDQTRVRLTVAQHPATPQDVLLQLAQDRQDVVSEAALLHPNLPLTPVIIDALLNAPSLGGTYALAASRHIPPDILQRLVEHPNRLVRWYVAWNGRLSEGQQIQLARDVESSVRSHLATSRHTCFAALLLMAGDSDGLVRHNVARHPAFTPDETLLRAWVGRDAAHRHIVALYPRTPPEILEALMQHAEEATLHTMLRHPRLTADQRARAIQIWLRQTIESADALYRASALTFAGWSAAELARWATAPEWLVRMVVALHPHTPDGVRQDLAQDGMWPVRSAAQHDGLT